MRYCSQWNTNSHHCHCAQVVVNIILKAFTADELLALPDFTASFEGLLPYTGKGYGLVCQLRCSLKLYGLLW